MRKLSAVAAGLVALAVLVGCTVPRPPGNAPLRYRDQIFNNVTVNRDLTYGSAPDNSGNPVALKLDLYQPAGDTQTKRPAVVWVHGGGYCCGDKSSGLEVDLSNTFAKLGYVAVSINYRLLAPQGCTGSGLSSTCVNAALGAQHDAQAAVRWLRANAATYRIDASRIGIGGDSAGAITATLVGVHSDDPGDSGNPGLPSTVGGFMSLSGGLPGGIFVGTGDAPGLLFHGTADGLVPYQWSVDTAVALLNAGIPAFLETFEGAGHVPYVQFHDQIVSQSDYFFYDFLDLAHAQGQPPSAARKFDRRLRTLRKKHPLLSAQFAKSRESH
ncbi:MAG: alpha/beta hydrolase [Actinomycetota bacterium]